MRFIVSETETESQSAQSVSYFTVPPRWRGERGAGQRAREQSGVSPYDVLDERLSVGVSTRIMRIRPVLFHGVSLSQ